MIINYHSGTWCCGGEKPGVVPFTQTTAYAIRALTCLAQSQGCWFQAREIASRAGVPRPYLAKVLHALSVAGLVKTKRGYKGGYALARPARHINLLNIVVAIEGEGPNNRCLLGLADCSDERACPIHDFWKDERERIIALLKKLELGEVAAFEEFNLVPRGPITRGRPGRAGRPKQRAIRRKNKSP